MIIVIIIIPSNTISRRILPYDLVSSLHHEGMRMDGVCLNNFIDPSRLLLC